MSTGFGQHLGKALARLSHLRTVSRAIAKRTLGIEKKRRRRDTVYADFMAWFAARSDRFFFVQVGANDGVMDDPIHQWVRTHNWSGILIEPQEDEFNRLRENYAGLSGLLFENVAIAERPGEVTLYSMKQEQITREYQRGFATLCPERTSMAGLPRETVKITVVPAVPLTDIVKTHGVYQIDLLQIDVEGYDFKVMRSLDFSLVRPLVMCFERIHLSWIDRIAVHAFLWRRNYHYFAGATDNYAIDQQVWVKFCGAQRDSEDTGNTPFQE